MPTNIYTWRRKSGNAKAEKRYLTSREVKAYIMKQNKWTADQYQKQYDIFKNKLRAYESYQKARGANVVKQSPVEVLYKEARAKQLYGPNYKESQALERIKSFSSYSITKGRQLAKQNRYLTRQDIRYDQYIKRRFGGFMKKNEGAKQIYDEFKKRGMTDYGKLEQALSDYASDVAWNIEAKDEQAKSEAIPSGEVYGSDVVEDFDIDNYL